jgi:hypothetical protein
MRDYAKQDDASRLIRSKLKQVSPGAVCRESGKHGFEWELEGAILPSIPNLSTDKYFPQPILKTNFHSGSMLAHKHNFLSHIADL